MSVFEKLGQFYLGKVFDQKAEETTDNYLLYDSKDLVTHALILKKSRRLINALAPESVQRLRNVGRSARFLTSDAGNTPAIRSGSVQLTVTSPPFLNIVQYAQDNWLRCWFNGIDAEKIAESLTIATTLPRWIEMMQQVFYELYRITRPGGWIAFEVGEINNGRIKLDEHVVPIGIEAGLTCHDYEPYATKRDEAVQELLESKGVSFQTYKDQVIFEKTEILSGQDKPYTVYTPYKNKWRSLLMGEHIRSHPSEEVENFLPVKSFEIPSLESMGFVATGQEFPSADLREELVRTYHDTRNIPSIEGTTRLSVHLRFGTISIRRLVRRALELNETWLDELIWREFFMMILWNFPQVVDQPFKEKYSDIPWRNNEREFQA